MQVVQSAVGLSGDAGHVAAEFVERSAEQLDNMYIGREVSQEDLASDNQAEFLGVMGVLALLPKPVHGTTGIRQMRIVLCILIQNQRWSP